MDTAQLFPPLISTPGSLQLPSLGSTVPTGEVVSRELSCLSLLLPFPVSQDPELPPVCLTHTLTGFLPTILIKSTSHRLL